MYTFFSIVLIIAFAGIILLALAEGFSKNKFQIFNTMNTNTINELRDYVLKQIEELPTEGQKDILEELAADFNIIAEDL